VSDDVGDELFTDAGLTAYLDGELGAAARERVQERVRRDPGLQARLSLLKAGARPFENAYGVLLEAAPDERLQSMLAALRIAPAETHRRLATGFRYRRVAVLGAVLLGVFVAGIGFDRLLQYGLRNDWPFGDGELFEASGEWRQAVADDIALLSEAALATTTPENPALRAEELERVAQSLDVKITPQQIDLPKAEIKRARIVEYEGIAIGQIAYLDPDFGPLALCIMRSAEADPAIRTEERSGFNIAYWSGGGLAYMLIGRNPAVDLQELARSLADRLPS
jgi:hypothetical protein